MCTTCGCGNTSSLEISKPGKFPKKIEGMRLVHKDDIQIHHHHDQNSAVIELERDILSTNQSLAENNRKYLKSKNIYTFNLVSSPGSGKTSLLERMLTDLNNEISFSVIEGDQQTLQDANRINETKTPVVQINTGKACHLDSDMISKAIDELQPKENSILFIENVGNLVCPALFDLGENERIVIISTTEGDDKPLKYPDMFSSSQICVINKIDLLPYVNFSVDNVKENALRVNSKIRFFELSATTGEGMDKLYTYLKQKAGL